VFVTYLRLVVWRIELLDFFGHFNARLWRFLLGFAVAMLSLNAWAVDRNFAQRFSLNAAGDITFVSSINSHCSTATGATGAANCVDARNGGTRTNNNFSIIHVDVDADLTTFNSSSAQLFMPAGSSIAFAGLYWAGNSNAAARNTVRFATPSAGYITLTAAVLDSATAEPEAYQAFAEVTSLVSAAGVGAYTVANIQTDSGPTNEYSGWTLVVVYQNASLPTRNMVVYDGYRRLQGGGSIDINLSGFTTPLAGPVANKLGVVGYDGDRGSTEGSAGLRFGQTVATLTTVSNVLNPASDVFNSTLSTLGNQNTGTSPNFANTLGYDADIFQVNTPLPNGATSAVVRVSTSGETIDIGVVTLVTDIFVPNIKDSFTKSAIDVNGGVLLPGDIIEYSLIIRNTGNDPATRTVVIDNIPANTTYLPGSILLSATATGIPSGARTDAVDSDTAEFNVALNRVVARIGRTATATIGGQLNPGDQQTLTLRVTVNANTPGDTVISNFGTVTFRSLTLGTDFADISDASPSTPGDQSATLTVASSDLTIVKGHSPTQFIQGQNLPTPIFTITVSNNGSVTTFGTVTVTDLLPSGIAAVSISGAGWTCTLASLICIRTTPLAPASSYPPITLEVSTTVSGSLTNSATVACACEGASRTSNNSTTDTVFVVPAASLSITKTNTVTSLTAGQTTSYLITAANAGPSAANGAILTDTPSAGLSCTSVSCSSLSGGAVCPTAPITVASLLGGIAIPTFPANSSLAFTVQCNVTATGL
jgi:uncharacterized repeat protein (TIGR01451 family)